jgi:hypothetical protein
MIAYMLFLMSPTLFASAFNGGTGFFCTFGMTRNTTTHTAERGT